MPFRALLLEDDPALVGRLRPTLENDGFKMFYCDSIVKAKRLLNQMPFQLAFVTRDLKEEDGLDFILHARAHFPGLGLIMLSTQGKEDCLVGLQSGADDCLSKPPDPKELIVRAKRLIQRLSQHAQHSMRDLLAFDEFTLDPLTREVAHRGNESIPLTGRDFDVLHCLARSNNKLLTRKFLLESIHDRDIHITERTIDNVVFNIRKKLRQFSEAELVKTRWGKGYMFVAIVTAIQRPEPLPWLP